MWDDLLQGRIRERQADTWTALDVFKARLQEQLTLLEQLRPPAETGQWTFCDLYFALGPESDERMGTTREFVDRYLLAMFDAKLILREHIGMEVEELLNKRDELILELAQPVRMVLATADAYTKFLSKCTRRGGNSHL